MELRYNMADGSYLMHYGVPGMKWGVRHDKERAGFRVRRMAKKDARVSARLDYAYGAGSRTNRDLHSKRVAERNKKIGSPYSNEYKKALSKQNRTKLAAKAQKNLARDQKLARKSTNKGVRALATVGGAYVGNKVGRIAGGAIGLALGSKETARLMARGGALVGTVLGGSAVNSRYRKRVNARRKLNYKY